MNKDGDDDDMNSDGDDDDMYSSVFQDDHLDKKSIRQTPFLGVLGLYIHPLKDRLPQTSVEGCPEDLFI